MNTTITKAARLSMDLLFSSTRWAIIVAPVAFSFLQPARAADRYVTVEDEVELVYEDGETFEPSLRPAIAQFGPFRVVAENRVELAGAINRSTPAQFEALLARYPGVRQIDMVECPGTVDDEANLQLARRIHEAGIATHVPTNGSIRSGGVELFLAGTSRSVAPGGEIGVHSWQDQDGREPRDFAPNDAVHQPYLAFYRDMGLSPEAARSFYEFSNARPFSDIHYMSRDEMERYGLISR